MMDEIMNYLNETNVEDVTLDAADESAIFLAALQDTCTPEEYESLVMENATELELYGLIESASIVTEATKIVKHKITKQENLNREEAKAAIRIGKKLNDADYKKYKYHYDEMKKYRNKLRSKFSGKSKKEARRVLQNSKRKASSMNTVTGKTIQAKMDKKIKEMGN